jgi:hypothetical protein
MTGETLRKMMAESMIAWMGIAAGGGLSGCASTAVHGAGGPLVPVAAVPQVPAAAPDTSADWRSLLAAPFGSTLKDLPFPVHEVFLFGEDGRQGRNDERQDQECYTDTGRTHTLAGRTIDDYAFCFDRDRLFRVEAAMQLEADRAQAQFAALCDAWLKNTTDAERSDAECKGRDGARAFSAQLDLEAGGSDAGVSLVIVDASDRAGEPQSAAAPEKSP